MSSKGADEFKGVERWEAVIPGLAGLRKKIGPDVRQGPWFQYHDVVGFEWNAFQTDIANLPAELDGFRIVQLSDLHCMPHWQTAYDELIDRLNGDPPDLIVLTGDIIDWIRRPSRCLPTARRLISQLHATCGVIGIFGNHDLFVSRSAYTGTPLRLIDGQRVLIPARGTMIELIAPPGPTREDYVSGFENTLPVKRRGVPRIILSHYPDHIRRMKGLQADIFLSGHTHGGQACLPGGIAIQRHDSLPLNLFAGAHRLHGSWFFVSRGFGFSTLPFRLFCPAEVIEVRLTCRQSTS